MQRTRTSFALIAASVASLLTFALVAPPASAVTTKWYSATTDVTSVSVAGTAVAFTVTNCGTAAVCPQPSTGSIEAFDIDLPAQWSATLFGAQPAGWTVTPGSGVVMVRSSGATLAPGASVSVGLQVVPVASDTGMTRAVPVVAKSNSSGTVSGFTLVGTVPQLTVQPLYLQFAVQPSDVQTTTASSVSPMCPAVTVQVRDAATGGQDVALSGLAVTLSSAAAADPLLTLGSTAPTSTAVTVATDVTGAAVFSNSTVTCDGLRAWHTGGPYSLNAGAQGLATVTSTPFTSFDLLQPCPATGVCQSPGALSGVAGTQVGAAATSVTAGAKLGLSVLPGTAASSCGDSSIAERPDAVLFVLASGDKTLTMTWSKAETLRDPRNGTPFWPVCMSADHGFLTSSGTPAVARTDAPAGWVAGNLPNCGSSFVTPADPCVTLSRKRAREIATVHLPAAWAGDPMYH